jgi:hypothetical protein
MWTEGYPVPQPFAYLDLYPTMGEWIYLASTVVYATVPAAGDATSVTLGGYCEVCSDTYPLCDPFACVTHHTWTCTETAFGVCEGTEAVEDFTGASVRFLRATRLF